MLKCQYKWNGVTITTELYYSANLPAVRALARVPRPFLRSVVDMCDVPITTHQL